MNQKLKKLESKTMPILQDIAAAIMLVAAFESDSKIVFTNRGHAKNKVVDLAIKIRKKIQD